MADQITSFRRFESGLNELRCLSVLLLKMEVDSNGRHEPDGRYVTVFDTAEEANSYAFLVNEIARRTKSLVELFEANLNDRTEREAVNGRSHS